MIITVNGEPHDLHSPPLTSLLTALREELDITSPKAGCEQGGTTGRADPLGAPRHLERGGDLDRSTEGAEPLGDRRLETGRRVLSELRAGAQPAGLLPAVCRP